MATQPTTSLTLPVLGMTCASCQHHVETALRTTTGVQSAHVDLMANRANVIYDPTIIAPQTILEAIREAGYDAVLPRPDTATPQTSSREKNLTGKAWITLVAGTLVMLFSMPLSSEMSAFDYLLMRAFPWLFALPIAPLRWILLLITATLSLWAGRSIYTNALRALRHRTTNMNTLVSLGTSVAFVWSAFATIFPASGRQFYFDAILLIIGFLLLGKSLEARAKQRALSALDNLSRLRPSTARRIVQGAEAIVPLEEIQPGDNILVLPGERFPVDAIILQDNTTVDESLLTGESTPLSRTVDEKVLAGSLNYDGAVVCHAESLGEATVLSQISRMVEQAQSSRAPMERLADRASAIFVPVVLALSALTFLIWIIATHSLPLSLANTVAVLVVACPCAMGLAIPAALTVAVGRGAQLGVLFKGGEAIERLANLNTIALDKTGTLTFGHPTLESLHPLASFAETDLLRIAAAAEEQSNHPLAHAIVDHARTKNIQWQPAEAVQILPGRGLTARIENHDCLIGNEAMFAEFFIPLPTKIPPSAQGVTRLWMSLDNTPAAYFDARDTLRPDAANAVHALKQAGMRVLMLTGDSLSAAIPIAQQAGIAENEIEASLDPPGKLSRIRQLQEEKLHVAMVGDGINDAAALAQADAGIAMASGADLAQEAGDVLLLRARPSAIPTSIGLARQTLRIMRQNLVWAAAYNLLGIPLAAGILYPHFHILLSPWIAAAAMALSSVSVLANSLRLRRWQPVNYQ